MIQKHIPGYLNAKTRWKLTSCTEEELTCWKTHFERVLNKECPIAEVGDTLNIDTEAPASEELNQAIKLLKNGKDPGIDQGHAELLKAEEVITP